MLAFQFLSLKMVIEFRLLDLNYSHELINLCPKAIEIRAVHSIERVVHEILKYLVNLVLLISKLQNVLAKIVHPLKITNIGMVEGVTL